MTVDQRIAESQENNATTIKQKCVVVLIALCALILLGPPAVAQYAEQARLVGSGWDGSWPPQQQGRSVALSSKGAAWIFTRTGTVWTQQGTKLVGSGATGAAGQGSSVFVSGDGTTEIVGGPPDGAGVAAAWVFTKNVEAWTQQAKLVGSGTPGNAEQGTAVALSSDGSTAIIGGPVDNSRIGAAWIFARSGSTWSHQGAKLAGAGHQSSSNQGTAVALSADGHTALVGGPGDSYVVLPTIGSKGAAWVWTRTGTIWTQQGPKLAAYVAGLVSSQGTGVALSADGNTAVIGDSADNYNRGAFWTWRRTGSSGAQHGDSLTGSLTSNGWGGGVGSRFGRSIALSADGRTALAGGDSGGRRIMGLRCGARRSSVSRFALE